jgi:hypothetical protein
MLLNSDIGKKNIVQIILHFQKKLNIIMCIIEKKILNQTLIISFGQNLNKI